MGHDSYMVNAEHMSDLQELTNELMQDPEFKKEYEALQPEIDITRAILDARIHAGMTQLELSEKSGISKSGGYKQTGERYKKS